MKKLILFAMALILAACAGLAPQKSELEQNQQKWEDQNISHYRFNMNFSCFCIFRQDSPLVVEVQDGQVVSMEYANGNQLDANGQEFFAQYSTIDQIFEKLKAVSAGEADEVVVSYDPTYGFPQDVKIDYIKEAIDDEFSFTISDFAVLP